MNYEQFIINYKKQLISEYNIQSQDGVYAYTQKLLSLNLNLIDGIRIEPKQIDLIFNNKDFDIDDNIINITIIKNQFKAFDYIIETIYDELSSDMIKKLHNILKNGTYELGKYRQKDLSGLDIETYIATKMNDIISRYTKIKKVIIKDIIDLYINIKVINPFETNNTKIASIIMLRECIKNNYIPIIFREQQIDKYVESLQSYIVGHKEKDIILHAMDLQKQFKNEIEQYII